LANYTKIDPSSTDYLRQSHFVTFQEILVHCTFNRLTRLQL